MYIVADFTGDDGSFLIGFKRSFVPLDTILPAEPEKDDVNELYEFRIEKEQLNLYLFIAVASILILAIIVTLCIRMG